MNGQEILKEALKLAAEAEDTNVLSADAKIIEFILDHCEIDIPADSRFMIRADNGDAMRKIIALRAKPYRDALITGARIPATETFAYSGSYDFGHTAPLWDDIMALGLPGLLSRVENRSGEAVNPDFVPAERRVLKAAVRFTHRAAETAARAGKEEMAMSLENLAVRAPETLYEGMLTIFLFYALIHYIEGTNVRTLGRLDRILYPMYLKETEPEKTAALLDEFMAALDAIRAIANIPFMLSGSDTEGRDLTNALSYEIIRSYARIRPANVKLHILCTEKMPADFLNLLMRTVRDGGNSMVFLGDATVIRSLEKLGEKRENAVDYAVVGCYECGGREETACTCNGQLNLAKALELALHGGKDALTGEKTGTDTDSAYGSFEALYDGFMAQVTFMLSEARAIIDGYEAHYDRLHASPVFTAAYPRCVEAGGDVYTDHTTPYANSSINAVGIATVTDALAAIRKLVYTDGTMTLPELIDVLDHDWETAPLLRSRIQRTFPRYGNADDETDALAARIVRDLSGRLNRVPNAKGGVYRLGLFSIDDRIRLGSFTAASADGRHAHETLSQNTGASFGADREGATAHLLSVTAIDATDVANGSVVDIDFHASAVRGEKGVSVLASTLETYLKQGGFAVHYNVLDTEVLRDAKAHPGKYPNLQVRLCGWNVKFTELSEYAQDEFIRRSEYQAG